jgi:hypothetical protein
MTQAMPLMQAILDALPGFAGTIACVTGAP